MLKDWIEVWDGNQYLLMNINNISVVMVCGDKTTIIMNNGYTYTVKDSVSVVYDRIYKARRSGI